MKEKNIQELAKRMGLVTVEDMCQYTIAQLVVKIANKVNELVGEVWRFETDVQEVLKTQNENIQYLLGEGLHLEVENIFDGWVQDGTFDTLLNQTALKKVNDLIDETNAQLSKTNNRLGFLKDFARLSLENDTDYLNRFFCEMNKLGVQNLTLSGDNFAITTEGITIFSNQKIDFNNSVLTMETNNLDSYSIFRAHKLQNISFKNGTLIGDRNTHTGTTGEWGMGIRIEDCENVEIENMKCIDFWGDGIYIGSTASNGFCKNIKLNMVECDNNRRQGLSVISVDGLTIKNSKFNNTDGAWPKAGIDFEPNYSGQVLKNIMLIDVETNGNVGAGILGHFAQFTDATPPVDIKIYNHRGIGANLFQIRGNPKNSSIKIRGTIMNDNPIYTTTHNMPISLPKTTNNVDVIINNPTIMLSESYASESTAYTSVCYAVLEQGDENSNLGGFSIINPTIIVNDNSPTSFKHLVYLRNNINADFIKNVSFINPTIVGDSSRITDFTSLALVNEIPFENNINILDGNTQFIRTRSAVGDLRRYHYSMIIYKNSTGPSTASLEKMVPNTEVTYINQNVYTLTLTGVDINGSTEIVLNPGDRVKLKNIGDGKWVSI